MTTAPFGVSVAPPTPPSASRLLPRLMLALGLWLIWAVPLAFIAATGPKFTDIFKEFGMKLSGVQLLALRIGSLLGSPVGLVIGLIALPALCFAVATLILPPRMLTRGVKPARWPLVVIAVVGSLGGSLVVWVGYTAVIATGMTSITDKLR